MGRGRKDTVGERGRNRTFNLLIKSQLLCQLSYAPTRNFLAKNGSCGQKSITQRAAATECGER